MMNGASVLEGYTPDIDATVVTRILDAGGEIAGKAHCEYYCFSGDSHYGRHEAMTWCEHNRAGYDFGLAGKLNATNSPIARPWHGRASRPFARAAAGRPRPVGRMPSCRGGHRAGKPASTAAERNSVGPGVAQRGGVDGGQETVRK